MGWGRWQSIIKWSAYHGTAHAAYQAMVGAKFNFCSGVWRAIMAAQSYCVRNMGGDGMTQTNFLVFITDQHCGRLAQLRRPSGGQNAQYRQPGATRRALSQFQCGEPGVYAQPRQFVHWPLSQRPWPALQWLSIAAVRQHLRRCAAASRLRHGDDRQKPPARPSPSATPPASKTLKPGRSKRRGSPTPWITARRSQRATTPRAAMSCARPTTALIMSTW